MSKQDVIGARGESIAFTRLTERLAHPDGLFIPHHLGDKCAVFDYLVEYS